MLSPALHRHGTVLIIVAGICALMVSLALTFLLRMRNDVMESTLIVREAQARIMLVAACQYIQEAARIGYDDSTNEYHKEGYGWIDIRDGTVGPKPSYASSRLNGQLPYGVAGYGVNDDSKFPLQSVRIFPMYALTSPPYAISMQVAPNPIDPDPLPNANGTPWLVKEDPNPPAEIAALPANQQFIAWKSGDPTPRQQSMGRSWFRLLRCGPGSKAHLARYNAATFIVTCGAGGTQGYRSRDWLTMLPTDQALFMNERTMLAALEAEEVRCWYLVEWSPAIGDVMMNSFTNRGSYNPFNYNLGLSGNLQPWRFPQHALTQPNYTFGEYNTPMKQRNFGGTISYVQRLVNEPPDW